MPSDHTAKAFDSDLQELTRLVAEMGGLAERQIVDSVDSLIRRDTEHQPVSAKELAFGLLRKTWRRVTWREGSNAKLASRFAGVRIRPAHRDDNRPTLAAAHAA